MTRVRKKGPKKYLDARRTQVSPAWLEWDATTREQMAEFAWEQIASAGLEPSMYLPGDKGISDDGAWILILEIPQTPINTQFELPLLSMWRARRHDLNDGGFMTDAGVKLYPQQAVIATPAGDLHLWPHEYMVAKDPMGLASDPDAILHTLGGEAVLDPEELFYLQSRGITHQQATMMLFDKIQSLDFVYVTFPEWITALLEGVGRPLHRHIALNPR
ncbi:Uncharacterized protein family (UPF0051) [Plantibacter flavus]|uniref:Uncharacterized protein UPF0051 n=1 Tax=Plantibacter flavus TaxID=150123 RepID=A0A3N2BLY8_9MICO|nr:SufD family Fe-S cluster assembly protein [Plantibacter flavus]ROR76054.1 uncharacterized protein UPF0051 [Plantibacter flavus]SMG48960.1 Uncharacterized protein family (UPF0051) [Plantibacter flavus]